MAGKKDEPKLVKLTNARGVTVQVPEDKAARMIGSAGGWAQTRSSSK